MTLNPVIHPINRLKICAALRAGGAVNRAGQLAKEMRFSRLAELTGLSDSALSKQLTALEDAGMVTRQREWASRRSGDAVWVTLTESGEQAFVEHMETLRSLAET
ncbi:transcriptional regulator [Corynebacterium uberis]|uniref:transcriptional regulator n=1 Tax=Corynebacterium TaxID=1716 RepID=UPI001D0AE315|nr:MULTISPECIES: transcriptional regulator [Corynebacterium]MCZ9309002.1 transcriptional regulator [Corynebacterium sp. c6VSa_13]UDL74530.1 transcriptional regulator [Corynebacterium uberis]UDL76636.1 transcriptional regulator [Corynebacterium uberis]UDL78849.1 transcriptional regulator [Corynebacterium uberis]UDL81127.1 transcriptional regulator [Corynebacterium uberis]